MRVTLLALLGCGTQDSSPTECTDAFYADGDADGHGDPTAWQTACTVPSGYVTSADDCDDTDGAVHPGAAEVCNDRDDDCDGTADIGAADARAWFVDHDGDGFGDDALTTVRCAMPAGDVEVGGDCDDSDAAVQPGAAEICNAIDDDCDELVDMSDPDVTGGGTWYTDADADGYGDAAAPVQACTHPEGTVSDATDCNDGSSLAHPGVPERCDAIDNDCNGLVDDEEATPPYGTSTFYADADGDGLGDGPAYGEVTMARCAAAPGWVTDSEDCDDTDPAVGLPTTWWRDADGDGYGSGPGSLSCGDLGMRWVPADGDCEDDDASVFPDAAEVCNEIDDNCDKAVDEDDPLLVVPTWYADADADGHGDPAVTASGCDSPSGYVDIGDDCDDGEPDTRPDAPELCDSIDNDCDASVDESVAYLDWYADDDGDGYGDDDDVQNDCLHPSGYILVPGDCDDAEAATFPGAREVCSNDADDDCDGDQDNCTIVDADLTIDGVTAWSPEALGRNMAVADVDDDGTGDLLLGCEGCLDSGEVSIVYGPVTGAITVEDAVTISSSSPIHIGTDMATGDADGDGRDDVLLASSEAVYTFFGPVTASVLSSGADAAFTGVTDFMNPYPRVDLASDVDGDGASDILVGDSIANCYPPGGAVEYDCGNVFVVPGSATGSVDASDATYLFYGEEEAALGGGVRDVGDATGDGVTDLALLAWNPKTIYLIDGGATAGDYEAAAVASGTIVGDASDSRALYYAEERSVDYDGDGYVDLLVGAHGADLNHGRAYLFNNPIVGDIATSDADVRWENDVLAEFGTDLTTGDVDGDGQIDVLFGAPLTNYPYEDGAAFLQMGKASGVVDVNTIAFFPGPVTDEGYAHFGSSVAFVPDWDGDDLPEMAIGASFWDDPRLGNVGRAYLWWSGNVF